ncbi:putative C6 transcription factor [Coniochaeta sp. 2T2.1]|nr:putative C6 transcription factor [Coniochaeta sp. 2T2.1]
MFLRLQLKSPNMEDTPRAGPSGTEYKTRRPHTKSRYGCSKCKERRIKCDELTPQCSRCKKMKLSCQYPRHPEGTSNSQGRNARSPESNNSDHSNSVICGSPLSSTSSATTAHSLLALPSYGRARSSSHSSQIDLPLRSELAQTLAPTEFELLKHYLEHTCKDMTVDTNDQYTVQIGIPNLAIQSKPLMKSVLALAATCKSSNDARGQVVELLSLANQYHMESLREIQATLPEPKQYDNILANAAMMGMYGSASHNTRIWLARTATFADQRLADTVPKLPQWMSLFRAVHLAYVGLLNNRLGTGDLGHSPDRSPVSPMSSTTSMQYEYNISSRSGELAQPRGAPTNHPLYPLLAATIGSAMVKLHDKAREIAIIQDSVPMTSFYDLEPTPPQTHDDLQACYSALAIFNDIVADTFRPGDSTPVSHGNNNNNLALDVDIEPPMGQLSEVSPWLRRYTASITSMVPSRLPRRTIMAFIHKVPTRYLGLMEEMISILQTEPPQPTDEIESVWGMPSLAPEPTIAHQLAMEIFAHWLVLVILLDNVWWIGGIGAWELGRVVASRHDPRWRTYLWNKADDWWPESMFEVSRQFDKHRT